MHVDHGPVAGARGLDSDVDVAVVGRRRARHGDRGQAVGTTASVCLLEAETDVARARARATQACGGLLRSSGDDEAALIKASYPGWEDLYGQAIGTLPPDGRGDGGAG